MVRIVAAGRCAVPVVGAVRCCAPAVGNGSHARKRLERQREVERRVGLWGVREKVERGTSRRTHAAQCGVRRCGVRGVGVCVCVCKCSSASSNQQCLYTGETVCKVPAQKATNVANCHRGHPETLET